MSTVSEYSYTGAGPRPVDTAGGGLPFPGPDPQKGGVRPWPPDDGMSDAPLDVLLALFMLALVPFGPLLWRPYLGDSFGALLALSCFCSLCLTRECLTAAPPGKPRKHPRNKFYEESDWVDAPTLSPTFLDPLADKLPHLFL